MSLLFATALPIVFLNPEFNCSYRVVVFLALDPLGSASYVEMPEAQDNRCPSAADAPTGPGH